MTKIIVVKAALDPEAGVWFVESSDMPGLSLEAESIESLLEKLPAAVSDLMHGDEGAVGDDNGHDVPIELIAHASTRVRLPCAA